MPKFEVDKEIEGSIDQAWNLLADFGGTAWIPGIESCEVEGADGIGQIRKLKMGPMAIHERLETFDPEARTLSYYSFSGKISPESPYKNTEAYTEPQRETLGVLPERSKPRQVLV